MKLLSSQKQLMCIIFVNVAEMYKVRVSNTGISGTARQNSDLKIIVKLHEAGSFLRIP
jgi:hypothetical protein